MFEQFFSAAVSVFDAQTIAFLVLSGNDEKQFQS